MIYPLSEGTYTVDISKKFIPFVASKDQIADRPASLMVDIVPFLFKSKNNLIVIDPGLGLESAGGEYQIHENIKRCGFSVSDVSIVLLSHLHKDHIGGVCYGRNQSYNLMFPGATCFCQQKEMDFAFTKKGSASYDFDKLEFLNHSSRLTYLNGNGNIADDVYFEISGGHTPYHQVFYLNNKEGKYFYGGDVLPQSSQIIRRFIAKYDFDGQKCAQLRKQWAQRAVKEKQTLLFFHDAKTPIAMVNEVNDRFIVSGK